MSPANLYQLLGVSSHASNAEIKAAYREKAKRYHPDLNRDNESASEMFKAVSNAYDTLSSSEKRATYDRASRIAQVSAQGQMRYGVPHATPYHSPFTGPNYRSQFSRGGGAAKGEATEKDRVRGLSLPSD